MLSGPGGRRPPGKRRTSSRLPEVGDRRCPEVCVPVALNICRLSPSQGFGFARATSIAPRTTDTPILHPIALQWQEWAEMALTQHKTKNGSKYPDRSGGLPRHRVTGRPLASDDLHSRGAAQRSRTRWMTPTRPGVTRTLRDGR